MSSPTPDPQQVVFAAAVVGYVALRLVELMTMKAWRRRRVRIAWIDPDDRTLRLGWEKPQNGKVTIGGRRDRGAVLLEGEARYSGDYPTWLINPETGWNYRAPTRAETVEADKRLAMLSLSNPASYYKAMARNEWSEVLRANDPEDRWGWVPPVAVAFAVVLLAGMAFIALKVSNLGAIAGSVVP